MFLGIINIMVHSAVSIIGPTASEFIPAYDSLIWKIYAGIMNIYVLHLCGMKLNAC